MRIMVMGDIHGAALALKQCLERSAFDYENDMLIQLGDVADGYSQVYECVEILLKIKKFVALKGNHDEWFLEFVRTGYHPTGWNYRGKETAVSYLRLTDREHLIQTGREGYKTALDSKDIPSSHKDFFETQKLFFIDDFNNCYVHAGFNRFLPFDRQRPEDFYWDRDLWIAALKYHAAKRHDPTLPPFKNVSDFNEIYIGHTPTVIWGSDKPMRAANILNVDTGAGQGGRLTIMDTRTKEYWQSDPVDLLYI